LLLDITILNNQVKVKLSGEIYVEEATQIRDKLLQYIDKGHTKFLIDLALVKFIDSSGLGVLVAVQKRALQKDGGVIIKGLSGTIKELFELTRLTKVFEIQK
jgi:anti-sigma B factor antagonist